MGSPPACDKCGNAHWRFVKCDEAKTQGAKPKPGPHRSFVKREGERPWGDRFSTVKRTGSNAFYATEKKSPHGGAVTYPEGFAPPSQEE